MAKILLIDEDRSVLDTLGTGLRHAGYHVLETSSIEEALAIAKETVPDLALVNLCLPDATGIELVARLRQESGVYSLFFTAQEDQAVVEQATRKGALGCLVRPLDTTKIIPAIESALDIRDELTELHDSRERLLRAQTVNRHISVAIGIYMERFHVSQIEAFETLRAFARSERRKLAEVAEELVQATDRRNELTNRIYQMERTATLKRIKTDKRRPRRLSDDSPQDQ